MKKLLLVVLTLGLLGVLSENTAQAQCCSYGYYPSYTTSYSGFIPYYGNGGCCRGSLHWGGWWY